MTILAPLLQSARSMTLALIALAATILGAALVFQHVWGYAPCHLCLQQRDPWWGLIGIGLVALYLPFLWPKMPGRALVGLLAIAGALALYNAGLSTYHAGVEWKFWPGPDTCASTAAPLSTDLSNLSRAGVIRCDEAAWRDPVLHLSMAGYNVLASLLAAAIAGLASARLFQISRLFGLLQPGLQRLRDIGRRS